MTGCTSVTLLLVVLKTVTGIGERMSAADIARSFVWPINPYWYLLALLWVFGAALWIDIRRWAATPCRWTVVFLVCSAGLLASRSVTTALAFDDALYLAPFFMVGLALTRFRVAEHASREVRLTLVATGVAALLFVQDAHLAWG